MRCPTEREKQSKTRSTLATISPNSWQLLSHKEPYGRFHIFALIPCVLIICVSLQKVNPVESGRLASADACIHSSIKRVNYTAVTAPPITCAPTVLLKVRSGVDIF